MEQRTRPLQAPPAVTKAGSRRRELTHASMTWVDVTQPTAAEATYLRDTFQFDSLALEDVLSTLQRPKLDMYPRDEYLFLILQVPVLDRDNRIVASEVRFFAGRTFFVSLHDGDLRPLRRIFSAAASDETARTQLMSHGSGYLLYRIVDAMFKQVFPILYRLDDDLGRLDLRISTANEHNLVQDLGDMRRELTALRHIVRPNVAAIHALQDHTLAFLQVDVTRYFGDCADLMDKLTDLLDEQHEVLAGLSTTLAGLAAERANQQLRFITMLLVAALPLLILAAVAALYAVAPARAQPIAFAAALLATIALAAGMLWYAHRRRWL